VKEIIIHYQQENEYLVTFVSDDGTENMEIIDYYYSWLSDIDTTINLSCNLLLFAKNMGLKYKCSITTRVWHVSEKRWLQMCLFS